MVPLKDVVDFGALGKSDKKRIGKESFRTRGKKVYKREREICEGINIKKRKRKKRLPECIHFCSMLALYPSAHGF